MAYRVTSIGELDPGFLSSVRRPLGISAFGANVIRLPAHKESFNHFHREQDELYFVHSGHGMFNVDGEEFPVAAGSFIHVESTTPRYFWNTGDNDLVIVALGGKDGYVERDGELVDAADLERRAAVGKGDTDALRTHGA